MLEIVARAMAEEVLREEEEGEKVLMVPPARGDSRRLLLPDPDRTHADVEMY